MKEKIGIRDLWGKEWKEERKTKPKRGIRKSHAEIERRNSVVRN